MREMIVTVPGQRTDDGLGTLEVVNPGTGERVGAVPVHDARAVMAAVERARATADEWGARSPVERVAHLKRVRRAFADALGDIARTVSAETGKPRPDAALEVAAGPPMLDYVIRTAPKALRPEPISTRPMVLKKAWVERSPYGVVGVIAPWNYPAGIPMQVLPWALAAGNAVVLKPSELTPLTGVLLGEVIASAGLPLVQVVTGDGTTGDALVRSGVGKIAFTGSGATARHILAAAAESLTPVVMELGGKDAMIVLDDADVERAARTAVGGAFSNAGQTCMAVERVLATPGIHDRLVDRILAETAKLTVGGGDQSHVGPLTDVRQAAVIERRLADAVARGARIRVGGHRIDRPAGVWMEPTVVTDVPADCELGTEETFGPVMVVERVADEADAVRRANTSTLGLSASVFTGDRERARSVASRIESGGVVVNDALVGAGIAGLPFGGEKGSGFGRLQGLAGFDEFSRRRSVVVDRFARTPALVPAMFTGRRPSARTIERVVRLVWGTRSLRRKR